MSHLRAPLFSFALCLSCSSLAQSPSRLPKDYDLKNKGVLLQVTSSVPVFSSPSPSAAKVAQADEGTVLLVIQVSKKKTWVEIEDESGVRGWVPTNRTDLEELLAAQAKIQEAEQDEIKSKFEKAPEQEDLSRATVYQSKNNLSHEIGFSFLRSDNFYKGFVYSLLFDFDVPSKSGVRQRSAGFESSYYFNQENTLFDLRFRYSSRFSFNRQFKYGPDLGVRFNSDANIGTQFFAAYRLGYDLFWKFPVELRGGFSAPGSPRWFSDVTLKLRF